MSLDACAARVAQGDPFRYQTVLAAPIAARRILLPIYAFNVEVTRAPWQSEEVMIGEMRLQWWRDALEEIAQGKTVRAHEIATPLGEVITAEQARVLDRLVAARRWDVYRDAFEDQDHFDEYIEATSAGLFWVSAQALGTTDVQEEAFRALGYAAGLAAFLRAVPELESKGRIPLVDGRTDAVQALAETGLARLALARTVSGPAAYPGALAGALLRKVVRSPEIVANGQLDLSEFQRRLRLMRAVYLGRLPL